MIGALIFAVNLVFGTLFGGWDRSRLAVQLAKQRHLLSDAGRHLGFLCQNSSETLADLSDDRTAVIVVDVNTIAHAPIRLCQTNIDGFQALPTT